MKVIFLDFNGVLDTFDNMDVIDDNNLLRLKRIVEETDSEVVIISSLKNNSYREGKYTKNLIKYFIEPLEEIGISIYGITPNKNNREDEITEFLINHKEIDNFCIIDDEFEYPKYKDKLVKTKYLGNGLEDKDVLKAIKILGIKQKTYKK